MTEMAKISLAYGDGFLELEIEDRFIGSVAKPRLITGVPEPHAVILEALGNPVGTPALRRIVRPGRKVALIVDDVSRGTPAFLILPHVIEQLRMAGTMPEDIRIVIALGTHRPMTPDEIVSKIGWEAAQTFDIVNSPCLDARETVCMGTSSGGIPALVNRVVAEADVRIGIGMITPHMDAGFSGGAKIILPGVCGKPTIEAFHARQADLEGNQLGLEDAPLRLELEAFVAERVGLDFIVNVVLDSEGALYGCVAGHFVQAHRAGVALAREVYGVPVPRRYPIVVSNAYPMQIDLWQSTKGIAGGELMVQDGGTLILVAHCREGNDTHPLFPGYIGSDVEELVAQLKSGRAEDPVACALAVPLRRIRQRIKIALVSSGLDRETAAAMGFAGYGSLDAALAGELEACAEKTGCIGVLTHGGVSLPIVG